MHSQRKLDARRARTRRRSARRRRVLQALAMGGGIAVAIVAIVALRPKASSSSPPILTAQQQAAATRTAQDWQHVLLGWRPSTAAVPVLMYHRLQVPGSAPGARELFVSPNLFRAQLAALRRHGYTAVTLSRVVDAWNHGGLLPRRPVVFTFDDGYRSQYTVAFQAMRRLGWPGTLFLLPNSTSIPVGPTDRDVRTMVAAGWEIAAHTVNHRNLRREFGALLRQETVGARQILQQRYGQPVENFAYPMGLYDQATITAVRAAGYATASTVAPGLADRGKPYELNRIRVDQSDTPTVLLKTLANQGRPPQ